MSNDEYQHQTFCKQINMGKKEEAINALIKDVDSGKISDGYHTFDELYEHRYFLFIQLARKVKEDNTRHVWRSIKHSDGTFYKDWFIMGINKEAGEQISYHLPIRLWNDTMFAETLDKAPEFDGHTSNDVIDRLKSIKL